MAREPSPFHRVLIVGGAGFIGSHLARALFGRHDVDAVIVFDNFTSGQRRFLEALSDEPRFYVVEGDAQDLEHLADTMASVSCVVHLASNPDIARAAVEPTVDFEQGTYLTHCVVEAARRASVELILYASGSGVYGDLGDSEADEDHGPLEPVSTYGASKLAGEALMAAYSHMFGMRGCVFRFGNVVGPRQTHGVGYDFVRKLLADPTRLEILGDGSQSKSYIHVDDVISAMQLAATSGTGRYAAFNVATGDYMTVTEIAHLAVDCMGFDQREVEFVYHGGARGWKGDVPVVRLATDRIRSLGWTNSLGSRDAVRQSLQAMIGEAHEQGLE